MVTLALFLTDESHSECRHTISTFLNHLYLNSYVAFVGETETFSIAQEDVVTLPSGYVSENQNEILKRSE